MINSMDEIYPQEADHLDVFGHLNELRKRIFISLGAFVVLTIFTFSFGRQLIALSQKPSYGLIEKFIFIAPEEVFMAQLKVSFLFGFFLSFPVLLHQLWIFVSPALTREKRQAVLAWFCLAFICFIVGLCFSYIVAIPAALKFLMNFGKGIAEANITLTRYISFFSLFMLAGGAMFEIPIIIGLLTECGVLKTSILKKNRRFAVIIICVISAIITPTQDIVNLLIFALPMTVLYELGIVVSSHIEKKTK